MNRINIVTTCGDNCNDQRTFFNWLGPYTFYNTLKKVQAVAD